MIIVNTYLQGNRYLLPHPVSANICRLKGDGSVLCAQPISGQRASRSRRSYNNFGDEDILRDLAETVLVAKFIIVSSPTKI